MKSYTVYRTFNTDRRREFVRITEDVAAAVLEAGINEGMVLVSAMHITAGVWINDDEPGIQADTLDLGPWQQVFYCEFDGGRPKRLVIKAMGE